jgi:hypothetical protein
MNRIITFTALAALIAGCSDAPVAPRLSLHATGPSFDAGDPPPPPVSGDGSGSFSAGVGSDDLLAASVEPCTDEFAATATTYHFVYTTDQSMDPIGNHQVAHIKFDEDLSHQIVIRQTGVLAPTVDANGMIVGSVVGSEFSFRIMSNRPVTGFLAPPPTAFGFEIEVTGILKTADNPPCETTGRFFGSFPESD